MKEVEKRYGNKSTTHDGSGAAVLLHAEPADSGADGLYRVSESRHGHQRRRLLLYLERLQ